MSNNLIEVKDLKKYFPIYGGLMLKCVGLVKAVDGVSFHIRSEETLGLVGESGCGKTTTGQTILRLIEPTSGEVKFRGQNVFELDKKEMRSIRRNMQLIFQDPFSSLNPRMRIGDIIGEPLDIFGLCDGKEKVEKVMDLLKKVGLSLHDFDRYPHEFSGGQRQRIAIARALILNPKFVVADEPVSSLDVSVRSQILNLMRDLQRDLGLTYLFISHDLSVVKHISNRVVVMYLGNIVEISKVHDLFSDTKHPYSKALISAVPVLDPKIKKKPIILKGEIPSPINPPSGCKFHTRCPFVKSICSKERPELVDLGHDHFVACHLIP